MQYYNQAKIAAGVKSAIAKGTVKREDLFITTKISPKQCTREAALAAVQEDIKELGGLTPDLVLHHFPCERHHASGSNVKLWQGLQDALKQGLTRSIGVSNYLEEHLTPVLAAGGVPPAVNQCQMSIGSHDDATIAFCKAHNITYDLSFLWNHLARLNTVERGTSVVCGSCFYYKFGTELNKCAKANDAQAALTLVNEMRAAGVKQSSHMCSVALHLFATATPPLVAESIAIFDEVRLPS